MTEKRFNDALNAGRDEPYTLEQFRMLLTEHPRTWRVTSWKLGCLSMMVMMGMQIILQRRSSLKA